MERSTELPVLNYWRNAVLWEVVKPAKRRLRKDTDCRQNGSSTQSARFGAEEKVRNISFWRNAINPALTWRLNLGSRVWRFPPSAVVSMVFQSMKPSRLPVGKQKPRYVRIRTFKRLSLPVLGMTSFPRTDRAWIVRRDTFSVLARRNAGVPSRTLDQSCENCTKGVMFGIKLASEIASKNRVYF